LQSSDSHRDADFESESEYQASAYNYDTSSEVESVKKFKDSFQKQRKQFKPSSKKKIQLTIDNLTVKTIPK
jgi:hypothetical protein